MDKRVEKHLSKIIMDRLDIEPLKFGFDQELSLINIVRNGMVDMIPDIRTNNVDAYRKETNRITYSDDPMKNEIYKFINAVTMFSRIAIAEGVPEPVAYAAAESYIYCADKYQQDFFVDALTTFTEQVATYKSNKRTSGNIVEEIKHYILDHLNTPIHIKDIAKSLFLSESHCSHVFKQVEGISIRKWIEIRRIKASCSLLKYSDMSVQAISEHFCFSRHSYYTMVFKREMGMTPFEYRNYFKQKNLQDENY